MANALSTSEITTALGAYNRDNPGMFTQQVFARLQTLDHVTVVECRDEMPLITIGGSDLIRPQKHDNAWDPVAGNAIKMPARILKVRPGKADLEFVPAALWNTWLGMNRRAGSADQKFMPWEQYFMEFLANKFAEEIQRLIIWKGVYNVNGTTPGAVADGFETICEASITANGAFDIPAGQRTDVGTISASTAYDQTIAVARKLPEPLRERESKMFMGWGTADFYNDDYTATFGAAPFNTAFDKQTIHGTNAEIVRTIGITAGKFVNTTAENMYVGFDSLGDLDSIQFESNRRGIDVMFDFRIGMQIADMRNVSYGYDAP
jgi:hypothetical protein